MLIIQSKYRKKDNPENPEEFSAFANVLLRLHPTLGKKFRKNRKVAELAGDIDWDNDSFELIYLTLGRVNGDMHAQAEAGHRDLPGIPTFGDRLDFRLVDEEAANK